MGTLGPMSFPSLRAYRILTERFELRCYRPEDAEELEGSLAAPAPYEAFDDLGRVISVGE